MRNIVIGATPGPRIRQEKMWLRIQQMWLRIRQEKLWLSIRQMWPSIRQKKKKMWLRIQQDCGRGFGKKKKCGWVFSKIVAEVSAREKEIWLRFQQIQAVANLISKHERGRKMREIDVTWYVWLKSLKLCVAILLYYMDDWSYKTLEKLLIDVWKWSLKVPNWCPFVLDEIGRLWAKIAWPRPWVSGVTVVTGYCPESRPWVCQSHGRDSASVFLCCFAFRRNLHPWPDCFGTFFHRSSNFKNGFPMPFYLFWWWRVNMGIIAWCYTLPIN